MPGEPCRYVRATARATSASVCTGVNLQERQRATRERVCCTLLPEGPGETSPGAFSFGSLSLRQGKESEQSHQETKPSSRW